MPRTETQNRQIRDDRRRHILATAVKLFATRGFAATKIADIAEAADMSHGLMYHYYRSKDEIFTAIVRHAFERMNTAARELERAPLEPRAKLTLAAERILDDLEHHEDFAWYSTLISLASIGDAVPDAVRDIIRRQRDIPYRVVSRIVKAGQKAGTVRAGRPDDLALLFWTTVKGLALHRAALGDAYRSPAASALTSIFFEAEYDD